MPKYFWAFLTSSAIFCQSPKRSVKQRFLHMCIQSRILTLSAIPHSCYENVHGFQILLFLLELKKMIPESTCIAFQHLPILSNQTIALHTLAKMFMKYGSVTASKLARAQVSPFFLLLLSVLPLLLIFHLRLGLVAFT